jgi:hypothetical protein
VTRPILEAFFHARYFLEMAVRYADLETPPEVLPSVMRRSWRCFFAGSRSGTSKPEMPLKGSADLAKAFGRKLPQGLKKALPGNGSDLLAQNLAVPTQSPFSG